MGGSHAGCRGRSRKGAHTNFFKPVLDKGARLARHHNTVQSAHDVIRSIMKNVPIPLQIQRELVEEGKIIISTAAGETVNKELNEQMRKYRAELEVLQEETMKALEAEDEQTRRELEYETRRLQELMDKMKVYSENMASNYEEEKRRLEEVVREAQGQAQRERERAEAAYREQLDDLSKHLQGAANTATERDAMEKRINQLQQKWNTRPQHIYRHPKYYMDTDMVVFQVDDQVGGFWLWLLTCPPFRSTVACTAYTSTSSCQRPDSSKICLPFHNPPTRWRRNPRKGRQTTPRSPSLTSLARNSKPCWISSTTGSCCYITSAFDSHCDGSERVRKRRRGPLTSGFPSSPFRLAFSSIGSVDERSVR